MIPFRIVTSMQLASDQPTDHLMDPSMDNLTDPLVEITHTTHHSILDQISETTMGTQTTTRIDRTSTGKTMKTEVTNKITGLIKEIIASKTGTPTTKTETGLTTKEDQTNINTTEANQRHR